MVVEKYSGADATLHRSHLGICRPFSQPSFFAFPLSFLTSIFTYQFPPFIIDLRIDLQLISSWSLLDLYRQFSNPRHLLPVA